MDKLSAYKILGLNRDADFEDVREAYRSLVEEVHPEEDPERFSKIQSAYMYLLRQNSSRKDFGFDNNEFDSFDDSRIEKLEIDPDSTIDSELGELFEIVSEEASVNNAARLTFENDKDAIIAFRKGLLHVTNIPPKYLAYLLKTYKFTKKDCRMLNVQFSNIRRQERQKLLEDTTRPGSFIVMTFFWYFIMSIASLVIAGFIEGGTHRNVSLSFAFVLAAILTAGMMMISFNRAKAKKAENTEDVLLTDLYSECIAIVNKKRGAVPESKIEFYISIGAAAINMIPFIISDMNYAAIFNIGFVFLYRACRNEWPKRACGFIELLIVMLIQPMAFVSVPPIGNDDNALGESIIFIILLINSALLIFKIIVLVVKGILNRKKRQ